MPLTPAGVISAPLGILRTMISNCDQFLYWVQESVELGGQTWPGTEGAQVALALDYIKLVDHNVDSGFPSPMVLIEVPMQVEAGSIAVTGDGLDFDSSGIVDVSFWRTIPADYRDDKAEAWLDFSGWDDNGTTRGLGGIEADLRLLSASGEYVYITNFDLVQPPCFLDDTEFNDPFTMGAVYRLSWGTRG